MSAPDLATDLVTDPATDSATDLAPALADVHAVTEQVWSTFLGEDEPLLLAPTPGDAGKGPLWCAAVSVSGGWQGTVTVELEAPVAHLLTRRMLDLDEAEAPDDADIADAVGELVNMVGGNIKSLMPGPSALTLPIVAAGRAAHPSDAVEAARLDATWHGHPVRVSVHTVSL